jgi:Ca2+-transporting ATPase
MPIEKIRTIMFVALSLDSIFFSFSFKSLTVPVWKINVLSNLYLVGALSLSILLLIAAITLPPLQTLLSLESLSAGMLLFLLGVGLLNLVTIETAKYFLFERRLRK